MKSYNTRIAPSPTGHAHIGTFRTALFNFVIAKATGGKFLLRIDDTDDNRNDEAAVKPIFDGLEWLGLKYDKTFRQSSRRNKYIEAAKALLEGGYTTELDNGAIALKWNSEMPRKWVDNIAGEQTVTDTNIEQIDNRLILLKGNESGNSPTYQWASTFDDWVCDINYIVRGTDHLSNVPKQLAIWWALNERNRLGTYNPPTPYPEFAHLGLIFFNGKKLSKRDGASSILYYKDKGHSSEAMFAFLLRLGWSPRVDDKDSYTMSYERAIKQFLTNGRMRNTNAQMDLSKLDAVQRKLNNKARLAA